MYLITKFDKFNKDPRTYFDGEYLLWTRLFRKLEDHRLSLSHFTSPCSSYELFCDVIKDAFSFRALRILGKTTRPGKIGVDE
jgi:hypothetical protein